MISLIKRSWLILWSICVTRDNSCSALGIPRYLHTGGRKKNNIFKDGEYIYRRFLVALPAENWRTNRNVSASIFKVDDDSCNRSKYSASPEDVLYNTRPQDSGKHYFHFGILGFKVKKFKELQITPIYLNGVKREFEYRLDHSPEPCMYPHTEIWVLENGVKLDNPPPKSVRAAVRDQLMAIVDVIKDPDPITSV